VAAVVAGFVSTDLSPSRASETYVFVRKRFLRHDEKITWTFTYGEEQKRRANAAEPLPAATTPAAKDRR
jgi:hypothetical protein